MNTTNTTTITLETPIQRGTQTIEAVTLRKPNAGELRGCHLFDLARMDVAALQTVLPRITQPMLTKVDVANMDPADLWQMGTEVSDFLLPKALKGPSPAA